MKIHDHGDETVLVVDNNELALLALAAGRASTSILQKAAVEWAGSQTYIGKVPPLVTNYEANSKLFKDLSHWAARQADKKAYKP